MRAQYPISILAVALLLQGCATTSSVRKVDREAQEALETAREAKQIALDAKDRSVRIEETVNRSFKKSMYK